MLRIGKRPRCTLTCCGPTTPTGRSKGGGTQHPVCFCFLLVFSRLWSPSHEVFSWPQRRAKATDHFKCLILHTEPRPAGPAEDLSPPAPKATSGRNLGLRNTRNVDMFAGATNKVLRAEKKHHRVVEASVLFWCDFQTEVIALRICYLHRCASAPHLGEPWGNRRPLTSTSLCCLRTQMLCQEERTFHASVCTATLASVYWHCGRL